METSTNVKKVKRTLNKKRLEIQAEKAKVDKLGEVTEATIPDDLNVMYAGKLCAMLVKMEVASGNIITGYEFKYPNLPKDMKAELEEYKDKFVENFDTAKRQLSKVIEKYPLWAKFCGIKGFTPYQLGLLMSYIKNPNRFDSPSKLIIYSGVGSVKDHETGVSYPVTKANLEIIKKIYIKQGKEFKGFNTKLSGRMFVVVDCLIRARGFFYNFCQRKRNQIQEKAINEERCEKKYLSEAEVEKFKKLNGATLHKDENGYYKYYMKGKKTQSLESWSLSNVRRRIATIFLHLLWKEWRELKGLPIRNPYVQDNLGHKEIFTLEQIKKADNQ